MQTSLHLIQFLFYFIEQQVGQTERGHFLTVGTSKIYIFRFFTVISRPGHVDPTYRGPVCTKVPIIWTMVRHAKLP